MNTKSIPSNTPQIAFVESYRPMLPYPNGRICVIRQIPKTLADYNRDYDNLLLSCDLEFLISGDFPVFFYDVLKELDADIERYNPIDDHMGLSAYMEEEASKRGIIFDELFHMVDRASEFGTSASPSKVILHDYLHHQLLSDDNRIGLALLEKENSEMSDSPYKMLETDVKHYRVQQSQLEHQTLMGHFLEPFRRTALKLAIVKNEQTKSEYDYDYSIVRPILPTMSDYSTRIDRLAGRIGDKDSYYPLLKKSNQFSEVLFSAETGLDMSKSITEITRNLRRISVSLNIDMLDDYVLDHIKDHTSPAMEIVKTHFSEDRRACTEMEEAEDSANL